MKKILRPVFLILLIIGAFWAASWFSQSKVDKKDASVGESASVNLSESFTEDFSSMTPGTVKITYERQQKIGVRVDTVEKKPVFHIIRVLGRVEADETRIYRINASVDGWINEAYYNTVGSFVKKGEVLATFTNPQFIDAEQGYLFAIDTVERLGLHKRLELGRKETPDPAAYDPFVLQRQMDLLRGMGMEDDQIEEIGRSRKMTLDIRITAPADGFITARSVSPKERFLKGTELYRIADLSSVWILADVYEQEVHYFKSGAKATVFLSYQDKAYHATVSDILPIFDASTRTLKVRLETSNPDYVLRPDMFVDVELPVSLPPTIVVPTDAVLHSGSRKTVFIERDDGVFEPRQVITGWRMGGQIEIKDGLEPGEKIVVSGNFFIDSESRLQSAGLGIYGAVSIDPVCGMEVDEARGKATGNFSVYHDVTYYFCTTECKEQFDKEPGQFTQESPDVKESSSYKVQPGTGHD